MHKTMIQRDYECEIQRSSVFLSAGKQCGRSDSEGLFPLWPLLYFYLFIYFLTFIYLAETSGSLFQSGGLPLDSHRNRFPLISLFYPTLHKAAHGSVLFLH